MNMLVNTIMQEKQRIDFMIAKYEDTLAKLPRGSLTERHIGEKTYYYVKYRDSGKAISKYIPVDQIDAIRDGIDKRKHTETMLASLRKEKALSKKILEGSV